MSRGEVWPAAAAGDDTSATLTKAKVPAAAAVVFAPSARKRRRSILSTATPPSTPYRPTGRWYRDEPECGQWDPSNGAPKAKTPPSAPTSQ